MKKFILREYTSHFWHCFDLEEYQDGILIRIIPINRFCKVEGDFVIEYEPVGGNCEGGWKKGDVVKKIYIGNAEFEKIKTSDCIQPWDREKLGLPLPLYK